MTVRVVRVVCFSSSRLFLLSGTSREPAERGDEVPRRLGRLRRRGDQVAAGDVDVVGEPQRHRLRREGLGELAVRGVDAGDRGAAPGRQHDHLVADADHAGGDLAGVAAVVAVAASRAASCGRDDELHREAERLVRRVVSDAEGSRGARAGSGRRTSRCAPSGRRRCRRPAPRPGRVRRSAMPSSRGDGGELGARRAAKTSASKSTRSILLTATTTCGTRSSAATARCRRVCSRTPLRASTSSTTASAVEAPVTMLRVYCTCPGQSARMKRAVGRGEVAVGDVDGDALLALGAQAVGEQREVGVRPGRGRGETRSTASSWSASTDLESCSSRPTRVDLPSSTEPAVARRSRRGCAHQK